MMSTTDTQGLANQASGSLYFEVRGGGRPVLLIPGTPGDGGQFDELAEILADRHLVITYDRAGTSRSGGSPSPTVADHADEAAALLRAQASQGAVVFGTSNGGAVALELALRHPSLVERVVVHEVPLLSVLIDPKPVADMLTAMIGAAMQRGGPVAALEAFLRFAFGDDVVAGWSAELRERILANAEMVFSLELPAFQAYRPDEAALGSSRVPLVVAVGLDQQAPFFMEAATWLAERSGVDVTRVPGAHGPQFTCPAAFAEAVFGVAGEPGIG